MQLSATPFCKIKGRRTPSSRLSLANNAFLRRRMPMRRQRFWPPRPCRVATLHNPIMSSAPLASSARLCRQNVISLGFNALTALTPLKAGTLRRSPVALATNTLGPAALARQAPMTATPLKPARRSRPGRQSEPRAAHRAHRAHGARPEYTRLPCYRCCRLTSQICCSAIDLSL